MSSVFQPSIISPSKLARIIGDVAAQNGVAARQAENFFRVITGGPARLADIIENPEFLVSFAEEIELADIGFAAADIVLALTAPEFVIAILAGAAVEVLIRRYGRTALTVAGRVLYSRVRDIAREASMSMTQWENEVGRQARVNLVGTDLESGGGAGTVGHSILGSGLLGTVIEAGENLLRRRRAAPSRGSGGPDDPGDDPPPPPPPPAPENDPNDIRGRRRNPVKRRYSDALDGEDMVDVPLTDNAPAESIPNSNVGPDYVGRLAMAGEAVAGVATVAAAVEVINIARQPLSIEDPADNVQDDDDMSGTSSSSSSSSSGSSSSSASSSSSSSSSSSTAPFSVPARVPALDNAGFSAPSPPPPPPSAPVETSEPSAKRPRLDVLIPVAIGTAILVMSYS